MAGRPSPPGGHAKALGGCVLAVALLGGCSGEAPTAATPLESLTVAQGRATKGGGDSWSPAQPAPLVTSPRAELSVAGMGVSSGFATNVSAHGDRALLGALEDEVAFVFARSAGGWAQEAELRAPMPESLYLGRAVSLDESQALVAAGGRGFGPVYAFQRSATTWQYQSRLQADPSDDEAEFGSAIAIDGDRALIGSLGGANASTPGSAFVFVRSAASWVQEQKLIPTQRTTNDWFGYAVALDGDTAVIANYPGPMTPEDGRLGMSSVFVFERGAASWLQTAKLDLADARPGDRFGVSLALAGDTILVGRPGLVSVNMVSLGSAHVFRRLAGVWQAEASLQVNLPNGQFGRAVALRGEQALVGSSGGFYAGRAYLYRRDGASWSLDAELRAPNSAVHDRFGESVAFGADSAVVAAPTLGRGYVFGAFALGAPCSENSLCGTGHCVDNVCCDTACEGACSRCNLAGSQGSCGAVAPGDEREPACGLFRCDGIQLSCPLSCLGDSGCHQDALCQHQVCAPKKVLGAGCNGTNECQSGHCIDGHCCDAACEGFCAGCNIAGALGQCKALGEGDAGTPSCGSFLCDGAAASCPNSCTSDLACAPGNHCEEGTCLTDRDLAEACSDDTHCSSGSCTDGVCCSRETCGGYRCGAAGQCETSCSSRAQCAAGHECSSGERCVAIAPTPPTSESGCSFLPESAPRRGAAWLTFFALAATLRRRRRRSRPEKAVSSC